MASLQRRASGLYMLAFRFQGQRLLRSLETSDESEARLLAGQAEQRLKHLQNGTLLLPDGASVDELWAVVRFGRMPTPQNRLVKTVRLGAAAEEYLASYPERSKEPETLETEGVHHRRKATYC